MLKRTLFLFVGLFVGLALVTARAQLPAVNSTAADTQAALGSGAICTKVSGINFNSANTDNTVTLILPTGYTRWRPTFAIISGASASLTTATFGVFTATAGGGTVIIASGSAITVATASEDTNTNMQFATLVNSSTASHNQTTVYFRVQTAQGSAATGSFTLCITPVS